MNHITLYVSCTQVVSDQNKPHHHRRTVTRARLVQGNVLFNDTLNTFYLPLYGVRHMVKDHSDREKGNPLPPHIVFN